MNLTHLDMGTSSYSLCISNEDMEDKLEEEDTYSTASNFTVILNPCLDLTHLLFLKSVQAEVGIESISVDSLPLTVSRMENIEVYLTTPPTSALVNLTYNMESVRDKNLIPLKIPLKDISTDNAQELVDQLNQLVFQEVVSNYIISKYCQLTFDLDIFKEHQLSIFNKGEANLLHRYLNITFYARHVIHDTLKECLDRSLPEQASFRREPAFNVDASNLWKYEEENADIRTRAGETKVLNNSTNLKKMEDREATEYQTINFDRFYKINAKSVPTELHNYLKTSLLDNLTATNFLVRNETTGTLDIPDDQLETMTQKYLSNLALIEYAKLAKNLLALQQNLHDKRKSDELLFENRIITLLLDDTKAKCHFHFAFK